MVVRTDPAAGSKVAEGTEITIYISDGPPTIYVDVPSLVGLELEAAKKKVVEYGFVVGDVKEVNNSSYPAGRIDSQDPDSSKVKQAGKGTAINLFVSSGKTLYTSDVTVNLPTGVTSVSLWIDGEMKKESANLDGTAKSYKFTEVSSANQTVTGSVKIKNSANQEYAVLYDVTIDLKTGKLTINKDYSKSLGNG